MSAHTPGPWHVGDRSIAKIDGFRLHRFPVSGAGQAIASVWDGSADRDIGLSNGDANAALIAAAPDLLEALHEMTREYRFELSDTHQQVAWQKARAAIAKAEGRA